MINFNPSESDFSKRRQIKVKRGRTEVWMGGNESLSFCDLVHKYHNVVDQLSDDFYDNYLEDSIIIGKKSVKSCISLSNRFGYKRTIELKRLIREWIVYSAIRDFLLNTSESYTGISGKRVIDRNCILNDINNKFDNLGLPNNSLKLFKHFKSLEAWGILSYRGSGQGFIINSFQYEYNDVNILDLYKYSIKKLYEQILMRSPSNYPSYFVIYENALMKGGVIKDPEDWEATEHLELLICHDFRGFVVRRIKELKENNRSLGNRSLIYQLLKVIYEDYEGLIVDLSTETNLELKKIWDRLKRRFSILHEHKKHTNGLKPQADAFVELINEMNRKKIPLSNNLAQIKLKTNHTGTFRENAKNTPNLGYDVINAVDSPYLFSGHGKGMKSIDNKYFSILLDLSCLILDKPKKIRAFYWAEEDTIFNFTRLFIIYFTEEEFKQNMVGKFSSLIDKTDNSFCMLIKLVRLLTKKTRHFLDHKQKITFGKIDSRVIEIIEESVLSTENFNSIFSDSDVKKQGAILSEYVRKWKLLAEYFEINDYTKTYGDVLNKLVSLLNDFYLSRLLQSTSQP